MRRLTITAGVSLILGLGAFFFVSSSFFGTKVLLPIVARRSGLTLSAESCRISPGVIPPARLRLAGFRAATGPTPDDTFVELDRADVTFSLYGLLRGRMNIGDGLLDGMAVHLDDDKIRRLERAFSRTETSGAPGVRTVPATDQQRGESGREDKAAGRAGRLLPLDQWLEAVTQAPLSIRSLECRHVQLDCAMAGDERSPILISLPDVTATVKHWGIRGRLPVVSIESRGIAVNLTEDDSRFAIGRARMSVHGTAPPPGAAEPALVFRGDECALENISGAIRGIPFEPIDVSVPFTLSLTPDSWTVSGLRLQVRRHGEPEVLMRLSGEGELRSRRVAASLSLDQFDGALMNVFFGRNGMYVFDEDGVRAGVRASLDLSTMEAEWSIEKVVSDFTVTAPALPEWPRLPVDVEFHHVGRWNGADAAVTIERLDLLIREGEQTAVEGWLARPLVIPLKDFTVARLRMADSRFQLKFRQLDVSPFVPMLQLAAPCHMGGRFDADLSVQTTPSGLVALDGAWRWGGARFDSPRITLAEPGRRDFDGRFRIEGRPGSFVNLKDCNVRLRRADTTLVEMTVNGGMAPGGKSSLRVSVSALPAPDGTPLVLAHCGGRPLVIQGGAAEAAVDFDHSSGRGAVEVKGNISAPLLPWIHPVPTVEGWSNVLLDLDCTAQARIDGRNCSLVLSQAALNVSEGGLQLVSADAFGDWSLVADFRNRPGLAGSGTLRVKHFDERIVDLLRAGKAQPPQGESDASSTGASSPEKQKHAPPAGAALRASRLGPSTRNSPSVPSLNLPVFDWRRFDLGFHVIVDQAQVGGHELTQATADATIRRAAGPAGQKTGAFQIESLFNAAAFRGGTIRFENAALDATGGITYTADGEIRLSNWTLKIQNNSTPVADGRISAGVDLRNGSGMVNLLSGSVRSSIWEISARPTVPDPIRRAMLTGSASAAFQQFGSAGSLSGQVEISGLQFRVTGDSGATADLAFRAAVDMKGRWENGGSKINCDVLSASLIEGGRPLAALALRSPFRLERRSREAGGEWIAGDVLVSSSFEDLRLGDWSQVTELLGFGAGRGIVNGNLHVDVQGGGETLAAEGRIEFSDLAWKADSIRLAEEDPLAGYLDFTVALENQARLRLSRCNVELKDSLGDTLSIKAGGDWNARDGGTFRLDADSRSAGADTIWAPCRVGDWRPGWRSLALSAISSQASGNDVSSTVSWSLQGIRHGLDHPQIQQAVESLDLAGTMSVLWSTSRMAVLLSRAEATLYPEAGAGAARQPGRLDATGEFIAALPIGPAPQLRGVLHLAGRDIRMRIVRPSPPGDLDELIRMEEQRERAGRTKRQGGASAERAVGAGSPSPAPASLPVDLSRVDFSWDGRFQNIAIGPMTFSSIRADGTMRSGELAAVWKADVAPDRGLNGRFESNLARAVPEHRFQMNVQNIPADQLAEAFFPFLHRHINGDLSGKVDLTAEGLDGNRLLPSLDGTITFQARNGQITNVKVLNELVRITGLSELHILSFFTADGNLAFDDGRLLIRSMDYKGHFQKLGVDGTVDLRNPDESPIDLRFRLALGAPLASKLGSRAGSLTRLTDADGYVRIPQPIGMKGTLQSPKPVIAAGDLFKDVSQTGLELIRQLLNRNDSPAPSPVPPQMKTAEQTPGLPSPSPSPQTEPTPSPAAATPDVNKSDEKRRKEELINFGIGVLEDYLNKKQEEPR
ncbi:MAG: hypothetical protein Kow0059_14160 [Candidatus Sumerlaeia bacterium]